MGKLVLFFITVFYFTQAFAGDGKLIATAGVSQVEGSAGGGLVPWAVTTGYDTRDETSLSVFSSRVDVDDYALQVNGLAFSYHDRIEISFARQRFQLESLGGAIRQNVFGAKVRVTGDVVYSTIPQISVGLQYKRLLDGEIASAVGAHDTESSIDFYAALTKVHLGAFYGYNVLWNAVLRSTSANEMGLLGYGAANDSDRRWEREGSVALLLSRNLAIGGEYREKHNRLGLGEDDWFDFFIAYFPGKRWSTTLAWTELGTIAGAENQSGLYFSLTGYLY